MDDIKANAAERHEQAAHHLEIAAKMHRDAAKQCLSGNYAKAQSLATSAAEADTLANQHAMEAVRPSTVITRTRWPGTKPKSPPRKPRGSPSTKPSSRTSRPSPKPPDSRASSD